jgi:hypothetical protein
MFLNLFQKVDAFLRNRPLHKRDEEHKAIPVDDDFWESLNPANNPWFTNTYWAVYRFFKNTKIFHPRDIYYDIKYFIQRGRRGWSDRDAWSIDWYLCEPTMMPAFLHHLKAHKHGTPMSMFPDEPEYIKPDGNPTEAAHDIAIARWDATMDRMIAGWEAAWRILDGLYEKELGDYPMHRPKGVSKADWRKVGDDRYKATRLLEERDQKIFEEGMALFTKHLFSLWD